MRNIININDNWSYSPENGYEKALPLSQEEGYCYFLEILGTTALSKVIFNEKEMTIEKAGFSASYIDITDVVANGENELTICLDANQMAPSIPDNEVSDLSTASLSPNFLINMIVTDYAHFSPSAFGGAGLLVLPSNADSNGATIKISSIPVNAPEQAMISYTVLTTTGTMLINKSVPASTPEYNAHLSTPTFWNGEADPYLYVIVAALSIDGVIVDQIVLPFGIRLAEHIDGQYLLNCKPVDMLAISLDDLSDAIPSDKATSPALLDPYYFDDTDEAGTSVCVDLTELSALAVENEGSMATDPASSIPEALVKSFLLQHHYHPSICAYRLPASLKSQSAELTTLAPGTHLEFI